MAPTGTHSRVTSTPSPDSASPLKRKFDFMIADLQEQAPPPKKSKQKGLHTAACVNLPIWLWSFRLTAFLESPQTILTAQGFLHWNMPPNGLHAHSLHLCQFQASWKLELDLELLLCGILLLREQLCFRLCKRPQKIYDPTFKLLTELLLRSPGCSRHTRHSWNECQNLHHLLKCLLRPGLVTTGKHLSRRYAPVWAFPQYLINSCPDIAQRSCISCSCHWHRQY